MKNYKSIVIASLILSGVLMYSCKKKSNSGSLSNILIATVDRSHSGSIAHYRFVYDAINDVDSIISTGGGLDTGHNGFTYFTYFGNTYTATDENNNSYTITDSGGVIQEIAIPDTVIVTYYRSLPSVLTIKSPSPYIPYYVATIADYSWANGDINYINIQGGATETYTYNTAKNGQIGDGCRIDDFLSYGKAYLQNKPPAGGLFIKFGMGGAILLPIR